MASPKTHPNGLNLKKTTSVILVLIISLTLVFPSNSDGPDSTEDSSKGMEQKKLALGSRPPGCLNKCLGCNPCKAALVISSQNREGGRRSDMAPSVLQRDREGYYLLSWKCKCGNKLFEP